MNIKNKFLGRQLSLIYAVICLINWWGSKEKGDTRQAEIYLMETILVLIGLGLYHLKKLEKQGKKIKGSKIIEVTLVSIITIFSFLSINSGSWYESPLFFAVTPAWIIIAYLMVTFSKDK